MITTDTLTQNQKIARISVMLTILATVVIAIVSMVPKYDRETFITTVDHAPQLRDFVCFRGRYYFVTKVFDQGALGSVHDNRHRMAKGIHSEVWEIESSVPESGTYYSVGAHGYNIYGWQQ